MNELVPAEAPNAGSPVGAGHPLEIDISSQDILRNLPEALTVVKADGTFAVANAAAASLLGFDSVAELLAARPAEVVARFETFDESGKQLHPSELPTRLAFVHARRVEQVIRFRLRATGEERFAQVIAQPELDASGTALRVINLFRDVSDHKRSELALRFLADASATLGETLDYEKTLKAVAQAVVPAIADWCAVELLEPGQRLSRQVAVAHTDPAKVKLAWELREKYPPSPDEPTGVPKVIRTGEAELVPEIPHAMLVGSARDEEHLRIILGLGLRGYMVVPLKARGRVLGALTLVSAESGRRLGATELALAESLASRAAQAVDNSRLFRDAQDAARRSERDRQISDTLRALGNAFAYEHDEEKLVQRVTDEATRLAGAAFGAFFRNVTRPDGNAYMLYTLSGVAREAFANFPMPRATAIFAPTFLGQGTVRSDDVTADPRYGRSAPYHGMPQGHLPVRSYLAVSVKTRDGEVLGGLFFGHPERGIFREEHERLIEGIAAQAGVALENARLYDELKRARDRLGVALEAGQLGSWEWNIAAGRIHWSPTLERIHGVPEGSFKGDFESYQSDMHPDDRGRVLEHVRKTIEGPGREYQVRYRIVRPDGAVRWLEARAVIDRDASGTPLRLTGVCNDVTERLEAEEVARRLAVEQVERKNAEAATAHSERQAALSRDVGAALSSSTLAVDEMLQRCAEALVRHLKASFARIWTLDEPGTTLELQASAGKYTHRNGPHGRVPVGAFKIGKIAAEKQPHLTNDVLHDERVGDKEWAAREGMVAFAGYPLLVGERVVGVMAMFATSILPDQTMSLLASVADAIAQGIERRRAEIGLVRQAQDLSRSNAELQQFAYVASHDLQEPLRMVASYTQLLGRRYQGKLDSDADDFIRFAVEGVGRMQALINDLLTYSRVGTKGVNVKPIAAEQPLADALANLTLVIEETGAVVTHDPLPAVCADKNQLIQLFQNLIGNAMKFRSAVAPRIHVSAAPASGGMVQLLVRDNGIGIAPEYGERVFVIFQRLHTRNEYPGNGIGLAVCKKIVERHGGTIGFESAPGGGTIFKFTLPAA